MKKKIETKMNYQRPLSEEMTEKVNTMNDRGMQELLLQLSDTEYWPAILRYIRIRDNLVIDTLVAIDPFKEPTETARAQGRRSGLFDLEDIVGLLYAEERVREEETSNSAHTE